MDAIPKKKRKNAPIRIDRCRKIRKGISAVSPRLHWTQKKTEKSRPDPMKSPTTSDEFHGLVCPPHCNANNKQQIVPINDIVPKPSMYRSFPLNKSRRRPSSGMSNCKRTRMERTVKLPIGTLLHGELGFNHQASKIGTYIQKHHLQETWSVNVPPRTGPTHTLMPNIPTRNPRCKDLFS